MSIGNRPGKVHFGSPRADTLAGLRRKLCRKMSAEAAIAANFHSVVGRSGGMFPTTSRSRLLLYASLMRARYLHVFPVLRDRAASDLDTLRLEDAGDLLVR